ncbi:MAG: sulfatase-like hydrolase/transferase [Blastocatellia bacterium]|nr:sulfatase-like hydrolase/transferase [Blastocatellia bacterium]
MSGSATQTISVEDSIPGDDRVRETGKASSAIGSIISYGLTGGAAVFLLSLIEYGDLSLQSSSLFASFSERLVLFSYFSLSLLSGAIIGLLTGAFVYAASFLVKTLEWALAKTGKPRVWHRPLAGLVTAAFAAFLLNQHPSVHAYVIALIREAEKFASLRATLLNNERLISYLIVMGLVISCWAVWRMVRASSSMTDLTRAQWFLVLAVSIFVGYIIDSRVEVQLYEYSLHRSMFLFNLTVAMALVGTLHLSSLRLRSFWTGMKPYAKKTSLIIAFIIVIASAAFTFARFDSNQSLKNILFYRTVQAKQHFKLFQWAMDFDRDRYSALLGGGDSDDRRGDINPGEMELLADGIDNNSIGGDLTQKDIDDWRAAFTSLHAAAPAPANRYNVIFVFIDALRPDHLSDYGYARKTSPNIDKLAARSSVFENAYAPAPDTYGSVPRFMQANYWDGHLETWTEVLTRNGYDSLFFPRRQKFMRRHVKGVKVVEQAKVRTWKKTIDVAIDVLGNREPGAPFCAYLYSFDPHLPYLRHAEFDFGRSLANRYDSEIAYTDFHLGRLFEWMERSGRIEDTVVVIMSDHGESLGERGIYRHSSQLYDDQMRVPIIVYVPGLQPRRVPDCVSTVDLGPTILNSVGLDHPKDYLGVSLLPLMRGEPFTHPPVFGEQISKEASPYVRLDRNINPERRKYMVVTQDRYKLIYNRNHYSFELYDLKRDPGEERNLYDSEPQKAEEMKSLLGRFIDVELVMRPWDADDNKHSRGREKKMRKTRSR